MFKLEFATSNAAFTDDAPTEVARILRDLADRIEGPAGRFYDAPVRDLNGNRIGRVEFDAEA
ncbi:hypothetical protein [Roseovarius amoyensis]|uniref:hypothetical protein n=1 Tax=Roseovarius amoyensis TaxID=2211448 RepID=UPI000DBEA0F5|nr:hypothetical protein [Roseovarius amoyensis]